MLSEFFKQWINYTCSIYKAVKSPSSQLFLSFSGPSPLRFLNSLRRTTVLLGHFSYSLKLQLTVLFSFFVWVLKEKIGGIFGILPSNGY